MANYIEKRQRIKDQRRVTQADNAAKSAAAKKSCRKNNLPK